MGVLGCLQVHIAQSDLFLGAPYDGPRVRVVSRAPPPASLSTVDRLNDRLAACNSAQSHTAVIAALTAGTDTATSGTPAWVLLGAVGIPTPQITLICTQNPPEFRLPVRNRSHRREFGHPRSSWGVCRSTSHTPIHFQRRRTAATACMRYPGHLPRPPWASGAP